MDRFEEIKAKVKEWSVQGGTLIALPTEDYQWLVAEVERLRHVCPCCGRIHA